MEWRAGMPVLPVYPADFELTNPDYVGIGCFEEDFTSRGVVRNDLVRTTYVCDAIEAIPPPVAVAPNCLGAQHLFAMLV